MRDTCVPVPPPPPTSALERMVFSSSGGTYPGSTRGAGTRRPTRTRTRSAELFRQSKAMATRTAVGAWPYIFIPLDNYLVIIIHLKKPCINRKLQYSVQFMTYIGRDGTSFVRYLGQDGTVFVRYLGQDGTVFMRYLSRDVSVFRR